MSVCKRLRGYYKLGPYRGVRVRCAIVWALPLLPVHMALSYLPLVLFLNTSPAL